VSDETPKSKEALPLSGNTEIELKLAFDAKGLAHVFLVGTGAGANQGAG
jgi:hypothetical protein